MFRPRPAGPDSAVDRDDRPVRLTYRQRRRETTGTGGSARIAGLLARIVQLVVSVIVFIIVVGILLVVLKANPTNSIVSDVHGWARSLAGPFDGMFSFHSADLAIAVNWGIAAVVYVFIGGLIASLIARTHL